MKQDIALLQFIAIALGAVLIVDVIYEVWRIIMRDREKRRELERMAQWRHKHRE